MVMRQSINILRVSLKSHFSEGNIRFRHCRLQALMAVGALDLEHPLPQSQSHYFLAVGTLDTN